MAKRRNPVKRDPDAAIFAAAADAYVKDKGYTESSLEAVRRAAKVNKRKANVRIGNYRQDI